MKNYAKLHSGPVVEIIGRDADGMHVVRNLMDTETYKVHGQEIMHPLTESQIWGKK